MTNGPIDPRERAAYDDDVRTARGYERPYDVPADSGAYGTEPIVVRDAPMHRGVRNGLGTAALVLGILGLLTSPFLIGGLLGLAAIICGVIGLGRVKRGEATNRGSAMSGIVLGTLAAAVSIALAVAGANFINDNKSEFNNLTECTNAATTDAARTACADQFRDAVTK